VIGGRVKGFGWAALVAVSLALAGCGKGDEAAPTAPAANGAPAAGTTAAVAPPAGQDWTETFGDGEGGGFTIGNPAAPVKLVEYGSLSCPHCADFEANALPILKREYIATGKVQLEFRNFVRDSADLTATLIARCAGAQPFFKMKEGMYASQRDWFMKVVNLTDEQKAELGKLPQDGVFRKLASLTGLDQFAAQRGVSTARLDACLADKGAIDKLDGMQKKAVELGVTGTPMFLIDGKLQDGVFTWDALQPRLKEIVGS
jgi:protein-disulfide isomerase